MKELLIVVTFVVFLLQGLVRSAYGAEFFCPPPPSGTGGTCLVDAIKGANTIRQPDAINLGAGIYKLFEAAETNDDGSNGLPSITTEIKIVGIVALNTIRIEVTAPSDCQGLITSRGNNLIGDLSGCSVALLSSDLTGDPGLGTFTDDGKPGRGHFPLLANSQAINAGNDEFCPERINSATNGRVPAILVRLSSTTDCSLRSMSNRAALRIR